MSVTAVRGPDPAVHKPRQEISIWLKYTVFATNFVVLLLSLGVLSLGLYLYFKFYRPISSLTDLVANPGLLFTWLGAVVLLVALCGTLGALRDNVIVLKAFSMTVFVCYILLVVGAFLLFILFYSSGAEGMSVSSILMYILERYHLNDNLRDILDYVQTDLHCCGVSSIGYTDWDQSPVYNCSAENVLPERCGVPYSCCRRQPRPAEGASMHEAQHSLLLRTECWKNAQKKPLQDLHSLIYIDGCEQLIRVAFESHAVTIGAVVGAIVIPVCISVSLANVLARQIERQRYLLDRQARRDARRQRRNQRQRQSYAVAGRVMAETVDETAEQVSSKRTGGKNSSQEGPSRPSGGGGGGGGSDDAEPRRKVRRRRRVASAAPTAVLSDPARNHSSAESDTESPSDRKQRRRPRDRQRRSPDKSSQYKSSAAGQQQANAAPNRSSQAAQSQSARQAATGGGAAAAAAKSNKSSSRQGDGRSKRSKSVPSFDAAVSQRDFVQSQQQPVTSTEAAGPEVRAGGRTSVSREPVDCVPPHLVKRYSLAQERQHTPANRPLKHCATADASIREQADA